PHGDWLHIGSSYQSFLNGLGPHTRRNLRYYRRRAEEQGFRFVPDLSLKTYESAVPSLNWQGDSPELHERDQPGRRFFAHFSNPSKGNSALVRSWRHPADGRL